MNLGQNLRRLRTRMDWSQSRLARAMADRGHPWRQSTVSAIETGRRGIAIEEADALATLLHDSPYRGVFPDNIQDLVRRVSRYLDQCRESLTTTFACVADVIHDIHARPRPRPKSDPILMEPMIFAFPDYLDAPKGDQ